MKRTLVLFVTLFCLYFSARAQTAFTAKEGYNYLTSISGLLDGKIFIAAVGMETSGFTLDYTTGKGTLWSYIYKSVDSTDITGYLFTVINYGGTFSSIPTTKALEDLLTQPAIGNNWANSDSLSAVMSSAFLQYVADNESSLASKQMALMVDSTKTLVWGVHAETSSSSFAECYYNAVTLSNISCSIPTTGVKDFVKFSGVQVFPNPASDFVNVLLPSDIQTSYQLCNEFGQVLSAGNNQNSAIVNIDLQGIASGVYFLKIQSGDNVITKKIVKIGE